MSKDKFKTYFVINAPITVNVGQQVKLTKEQAQNRKHVAKNVKDDIWEAISPFQFKAGEVFIFNGEINKKFADQIIDPEKIEPEPEPELDQNAKEDQEKFDPLEILQGMSTRQLQYYARTKCDGLKLELKLGVGEMIKTIKAYHVKPVINKNKS